MLIGHTTIVAGGLSQYFTQDLEDMLLIPPSADEPPPETTPKNPDPAGQQGPLCTKRQRQAIRALLPRARRRAGC